MQFNRWIVPAAAAAICVMMPFAPAWGRQNVEFKSGVAAGASMAYTASHRLELSQKRGEAEATSSTVDHEARLAFKVDALEPDGTAKVSVSVKALRIAYNVGATAMTFDKRGGQAGEGSSDEDLRKLGDALMASTITLNVAPDGSLGDVGGLQSFLEAASGQQKFDERIVGIFTPAKFSAFVAPLFSADGARGKSMSVGTGWQVEEETVRLPPVGAMEFTTDYRLASAEGGTAKIEGTTNVTLLRPREADPAVASVTIAEQKGRTEMLWDTAAGQLRSRERQLDLTTVWSLGEVKIEQKQNSRTRLERIDAM